MQYLFEKIHLLPNSTENLWTTLMELEQYGDSAKKTKTIKTKDHDASAVNATLDKYPVSRFGAHLAAALLRMPDDTEYCVMEE
jgi:hypothetical protein